MAQNKKSTYVAMLRGVNVSGKNMIKMPALVKSIESIGFKAIRSYIQSGNLVFETATGESLNMARRIHDQINNDFGFDIPVLVIEAKELESIRDENPFVQRSDIDLTKLHVTFLESEPEDDRIALIDPEKYLPDEFVLQGRSIYLYCPIGYGTTKLNNNFFESKLKARATTRNWNTVNKLVEMAKEEN